MCYHADSFSVCSCTILLRPWEKELWKRSAAQHLYWSVFNHRAALDRLDHEERRENRYGAYFHFGNGRCVFICTVSGFTHFILFNQGLQGPQGPPGTVVKNSVTEHCLTASRNQLNTELTTYNPILITQRRQCSMWHLPCLFVNRLISRASWKEREEKRWALFLCM